jgi:phospholipase C
MNGFNDKTSTCAGANGSYHYVDNSTGTVQPYFDMATNYGYANYMFQTNEGPSYPAHQFLLSGTSAPSEDSDLFAIDDPGHSGCAAPPTSEVKLIAPDGAYSFTYPCFTHDTLVDLLVAAGLSWKYYATKGEGYWYAPNSISTLYTEPFYTSPTVLTDIQKCQLANVSWVTPTGPNSDHGGGSNPGGPSWVASIINAIGDSPCGYWQNTAILVTWDDWGGWYDHVPPPMFGQTNGWGVNVVYGFRVPLLVVSAYTPPGYVDNTVHDFGSMLHFVETNFGLGLIGPGTYADSYADDLMAFFPLTVPNAFVPIPARFNAAHFINHKVTPADAEED